MAGIGGLFGATPSVNYAVPNTYLNALGTLGQTATSGAGAANTQYGNYNAQDMSAINALSNYYTQNPGTDQQVAQDISRGEQGNAENEARGSAALSMSLARSGISPNSSIGAGAQTQLINNENAVNTNVNAQEASHLADERGSNLAANANLLTGASNNAFSKAQTLSNSAAGYDSNLYTDTLNQSLQQYQEAQQKQAQQAQLWGTVADAAGDYFGVPGVGKVVGYGTSGAGSYGNQGSTTGAL